ncbi:hypothetical protein [Bacillus toyonensis]|uniref:hypothetical protein n=1 Tax=Bacillus toyonensis TaxID=155322 RepID=UPI0015CF0485|nr:hypothetical protein [Bacillus toyonensis]
MEFTIDSKVSVDGSTQYKVHNSKAKTYYVTANEAFVYVNGSGAKTSGQLQ